MLADLLQALSAALTTGSMYALVAVGIALIFSASGIINFAQGEFVMLGGMIMVSLYGELGWPLALAIPATLAIATAVGCGLMAITVRPGSQRSVVTVLIITIGASMAISGVARQVWDADIHRFPAFSGDAPIALFGAAIAPQSLWIIATAGAAIAAVGGFLRYTLLGKAMKACAIDPVAAGLMGMRVRRMIVASFVLSAALGAVAGIVCTPLVMVDYAGGIMLAIKGLAAAMLGGMGSVAGGALGGFLIAALEAFSASFLSGSVKEIVTFAVIINVLLFFPRGLAAGRAAAPAEDEGIE